MPCLFERMFKGPNQAVLLPEVAPGCQWVFENITAHASIKWDGTACMFKNEELYKRYDAKVNPLTGQRRVPPANAIPCIPEPDPNTGHWPHWVPIGEHDRWHVDALRRERFSDLGSATYELIGPKINANPHRVPHHRLVRHGAHHLGFNDFELSYEGIRGYLEKTAIEGIVFAHPDGRFAKIRRKDFGFSWP